jgi:hypothetical protein
MPEERRTTRWRSPDEPCLNCGNPTPGRYCPDCGQRKADVAVSLRAMVTDVLEDQFILSRALPRTVVGLLLRPGFLTAEYVGGRIVRYIPPFRLYLVSSVIFFLLVSFIGLRALERVNVGPTGMPADSIVDPDSVRAALLARDSALASVDTLNVPAPARAIMRQMREATGNALATLDTAGSIDRAAYAAIMRPGMTDTALPVGVRQPWARDLTYNTPWPWLQRALDRKVDQIGHLTPRDAARAVIADMLGYAPHMVFVLLPVFAFMLKVLYLRRKRYYAEHFVFALHVHAFFFVTFIIMLLLPWGWIDAALVVWMMMYIWLAMRRVYRQGWFRTTVKWGVLGAGYAICLLLGMVGLMISALLLA